MNQNENVATAIVISSAKTFLMGWGMMFTFVLLNSFGTFLFKTQIQKLGTWNFTAPGSIFSYFFALLCSWQTWLGLTSLTIAIGAWIVALAHLELSRAYPVAIGSNLLIILVMSLSCFQESISFSKILGTFLIFLGIVIAFK